MRRRTESSTVARRSVFVRRGSALAIVLRAATKQDTVTKPLTNCFARERPFYIAMSRLIASPGLSAGPAEAGGSLSAPSLAIHGSGVSLREPRDRPPLPFSASTFRLDALTWP